VSNRRPAPAGETTRVQALDNRSTIDLFRDRPWEFGLAVRVLVTKVFLHLLFLPKKVSQGIWSFDYATLGFFDIVLHQELIYLWMMDKKRQTG
jgi:hypothetical protein